MAPNTGSIFSATYSNVPVYELLVDNTHVMRRRCDDYINATHILKVAEYDKPARTRILEREVQKGVHEKIQGGYGKYQGTWIPLHDGKLLAQRNNVFEKLQLIFDYVPSNVSPPPAPKHSTNPSRPKAPRVTAATKKAQKLAKQNLMSDDYDNMSMQLRDDDSQDAETIETRSFIDEDDAYGSQIAPGSRKRKRGQEKDLADHQHTVFADALLDYFILSSSENASYHASPPVIPENFQINRPIDDHGHTALHWAVAMGDLGLVRTLIARGADTNARNRRGETPIIRAVTFTNNFEKETMPELLGHLQESIISPDHFNATVLHHTMMTTNSRVRRKCALYYLHKLLDAASRILTPQNMDQFLNHQDKTNGDTALHIAARFGTRRCFKLLMDFGAHAEIANHDGESVDQIVTNSSAMHQDLISSSPPPLDIDSLNDRDGTKPISSQAAMMRWKSEHARSFSQSFEEMANEKSNQVAFAMDQEWHEKCTSLEEAEQAAEKIAQERQQIHQESLQYLAQDTTGTDEELAQLEREYQLLVRHGQAYSESLQHRELHSSIRESDNRYPKEAHFVLSNGIPTNDQTLEERVRAGVDLAYEQDRRRRLTAENVDAKSLAGMSSNGEALKRLVANATNVPIEQVVDVASDLLEALQSSKTDLGAEIPVGA